MKKLILTVTTIIGIQAFASTNDWFDAGIKDYTNWPTNEIVDAGVWLGADGANLIGEAGARRLALTGNATLKFAVEPKPQDVITHVFSTTVRIPDGRELTDPSSAKGGIGVKRIDSEDDEDAPLAYFGIVKDGETNVWTRLYGAEPSLEKDVKIEMLTCASMGEGVDDTVRVAQYLVDGVVLSNAQNEVWFKVGMMAEEFKTEVAYAGSGEVAALSGEVEVIDREMSVLTVPEIAGATPAVMSRGRTIWPNEEGKYVVPQGFEVTVSYTIDEDYRVLGGETSYTITPNGATSEIVPTLETKAYSDVYKFLRFIAFDGIPAGETEADANQNEWIELQNTGDKSIDLKDVKFIIGKKKDVSKNPEDAKCKLVFEEGMTLAAGATLRLEQADWTEKGWEKITNGDLIFILTDAEGVEVQKGEISQSTFKHYYGKAGTEVIPATETEEAVMGAGGDTYLYTRNFAHELVNGDWSDSYVPDVPGSYNAKFNSVYISEFMAKNSNALKAKCGLKESDWIELTNGSGEEVDLTGWAISDDPEKLFQVKLPDGTKIGAGGTLVLFCDKKPPKDCTKDIHIKFSLSTDAGEYLLLTDPNTNTTTKICYDAQLKDVSCGFGHIEEPIATKNTQYKIGAEGEWKSTTGGIGMTAQSGNYFAMKYWSVNSTAVPNFDAALEYMEANEPTSTHTVNTISFVNLSNDENSNPKNSKGDRVGLAPGAYAYTGMTLDSFEGIVYIPETGDWSFAISNSAYVAHGVLGAQFSLSGKGVTLSMDNEDNLTVKEPTNSGAATYNLLKGVFNIPQAGAYRLNLVYCGGNNGSANRLFLYAGKGDMESEQVTLRLVNGTSTGALKLVSEIATEYDTDVSAEMLGKATTAEWKTTFTIDGEISAQDTYYLKAHFADGLVASVNGEVLREHQTVKRSTTEATAWTEIIIPANVLKTGENGVLLTVENDMITDTEFLASAVVVKVKNAEALVYFPESTPGALNTTTGRTAPTKKVTLSEPHGYKTGAFELTMSCAADPEARIYYTTNGVSPTVESGILYEGPITISSTTCIRAAVPDAASILQNDTSATYLYLEDILTQPRYYAYSQNGKPEAKFYTSKGFMSSVNNGTKQTIRYGFNQNVLNQAGARQRIEDGMLNGIDTIALVIDPKNLFNESSGIYKNAVFHGRAWERLTMIESICPTNSANDFTIQAGLRIRGGSSRQVDHPKHSFRFYFRSDYGAGSLEKNIFGDEGVGKFGKLDLRTSQNWSLANENSRHDTFIHETFLRDTQRDMGEPYTRSRYYHLYINGIYWGLYETQERVDEEYAASYLKGEEEDYDIIKRSMGFDAAGNITGSAWETAAGSSKAYKAMGDLAKDGAFAATDKYLQVLGFNADGSRNTDYPIYVNPENLMKYVLINHYTCNIDSPFIGKGGGINNLYAVRNRVDDESAVNGFVFLCHDGEHSMGTDTTVDEHRTTKKDGKTVLQDGADWRKTRCHYNRTDMTFTGTTVIDSSFTTTKDGLGMFGPAELNYQLMQNAEYRMAFADMVYKMCFKEGGALTVPVAKARFESRMAEIDDAIMAEIARWDSNESAEKLPTHATWEDACGECLEFIEKRLPYLIQGYREAGWYPTNEPPAIVAQDGVVTLSSTNENVTLYYTLDGSDPRAVGGAVAGNEYTEGVPVPTTGVTIKVRSLAADGTWSALNELKVEGEVVEENPQRQLRLAEIYGSTNVEIDPDGDTGEFVVLTNLSDRVVSLVGLKLKSENMKKSTVSFDVVLTAGEVAPLGAFKVEKAAAWPDSKISNGKIRMTITDSDGVEIQVANTEFAGDADGKGASLIAQSFDNPCDDWVPGPIHDVPATPDEPEDPGEEIPEDAVVLTGDITGPTNLTAGAYYLKDAKVTGGIVLDGAVTFHLVSNTTSQVDAITGANDLTVEGKGAISLTGANALMQVKNLTVNDGVLNVTLAATVDKAKAIALTGNFTQNGGEITMDLTGSGVVYGIYQDTKKIEMKLNGGTFTATIAGAEKSAVLKGNKGSNDITFNGTKVVATLGGTGPRFATSDGKIKVKDGSLKLNSAAEGGENARALSANEKITISGGVMKSELTATGSEVLSCDDAIEVTGGVMSLVADDDCFSAATNVTISAGKVQTLSRSGDAIDSNGSITISGGYVFATTLSSEHEALDVDPAAADGLEHKLFITGGTVVAAGGANMLHTPDEGSVDCIIESEITSLKKYLVLTGLCKSTKTILSVNLEAGKKRNADGFSLIATMPGLIKPYADTKTKPSEATPPSKKLDDDIDGVFIRSYSTATLIQLF